MGAVISFLIQIAILGGVLALALVVGWLLARIVPNHPALKLGTAAFATAVLAIAIWRLVHDSLQKVDTDQVAVATLVTSVVGVLWLTGMATGYALTRPRA